MTMPSKIYLDGHEPTKHFPEDTEYADSVPYIRSDIAEELARALKEIRDESGNLPHSAKLSLARYNAAIHP